MKIKYARDQFRYSLQVSGIPKGTKTTYYYVYTKISSYDKVLQKAGRYFTCVIYKMSKCNNMIMIEMASLWDRPPHFDMRRQKIQYIFLKNYIMHYVMKQNMLF